MIDFTEQVLSKRPELALLFPEEWDKDFDVCRGFSTNIQGSNSVPEGSGRIRRPVGKGQGPSRLYPENEKMNALDFEIVDDKERKEERAIGRDLQKEAEGREIPAGISHHGTMEEGIRPMEREREREH